MTTRCHLCDSPDASIDLYVNGMPEPICESCARDIDLAERATDDDGEATA